MTQNLWIVRIQWVKKPIQYWSINGRLATFVVHPSSLSIAHIGHLFRIQWELNKLGRSIFGWMHARMLTILSGQLLPTPTICLMKLRKMNGNTNNGSQEQSTLFVCVCLIFVIVSIQLSSRLCFFAWITVSWPDKASQFPLPDSCLPIPLSLFLSTSSCQAFRMQSCIQIITLWIARYRMQIKQNHHSVVE